MTNSTYLTNMELDTFRTDTCSRLNGPQQHCKWGDRCQFSHVKWSRRRPSRYSYTYHLCNDVSLSNPTHDICTNRHCRSAHSREEQLFHPKLYKTLLCTDYERYGTCPRFYCPLAHGISELNDFVDGTIDFTFNI
eukprot:GHVR01048164.1.p1 GENE.GHVR01048164.1~~GHVR01048164.1.p1  ORF type:complete len:135 (-),score=5.71 GHVR01048164.1:109-513(-)